MFEYVNEIEGVIVDGLNVEEAHFRGRKLQGTTVAIPHGYSGKLSFIYLFFKKKNSSIQTSLSFKIKLNVALGIHWYVDYYCLSSITD